MQTSRRAVVTGLILSAAGVTKAADPETSVKLPAPSTASTPAPTAAEASVAALPAAPVVAAAPTVPAAPIPEPPFKRFAVTPLPRAGKPIICIVIDDLGVMHRGTERTVLLPGPMTLSWFPFAHNLPEQVAFGMAHGHENTLHMPMQAFGNSTYQTGPDPLRIDLPAEVNLARLRAAMDAVPNAVGLNNHMGSVATKDVVLMDIVAQESKARGMLFLDSLTIGGSVAAREAHAAGIPADSRDVFIDNSPNPTLIHQQLLEIEHHATKHGHVIAIGHPRPHTLDALEAWMPTLAPRGFVLWPLAATIALRAQERAPLTPT